MTESRKRSRPAMSDDEQRRVVEAIARNTKNHPRDRIAAIRTLQAMSKRLLPVFEKPEPPPEPEPEPSELDRELARLVAEQ